MGERDFSKTVWMRSDYKVLTPESVEFTYELAGPASRMLAALLDHLILAAIWMLAGLVTLFASGLLGGLGLMLAFVATFAVSFGYFTLQEWKWNGQTIGKRMLDLRVIDERGFSIDLFQSFIRNLLRTVDAMPFFPMLLMGIPCYAFGGAAALANPRLKRLGDFAAGTIVVKVRRAVRPQAVIAPDEKYNTLQDDAALRHRIRTELTLEERELMLQLCLRRHELDFEARRALFEEAAAFLEGRLRQKREPFLSAEKFVQNVAAVALAESPRGLRRSGPLPGVTV